MIQRRQMIAAAIGTVLIPDAARPQNALSSAGRLNELGAENEMLARRQGFWDVIETVWAAPGAAPIATTGLVAERRMIGSLLHEEIRPIPDAAAPVKRLDVLTYNRVEGRWEYASFDTRAPVGLMPAQSYDRGDGTTIELRFEPFAYTLDPAQPPGRLLRMRQTIVFETPDSDVKDQVFIPADGTGTQWLAHRYAYARRP